jgi:hypothetical protein
MIMLYIVVGRVYSKVNGRFAQDFDVFLLKTLPPGGRRLAYDIPLESVYLFLHLTMFYQVNDSVECGIHGCVPVDKSRRLEICPCICILLSSIFF